MEQCDILSQERELYLIKRILLHIAQWFDLLKMRFSTMVQPAHFTLVSLEQSALDECINRWKTMTCVQQFVACNLNDSLPAGTPLNTIPMRQRQIIYQSR